MKLNRNLKNLLTCLVLNWLLISPAVYAGVALFESDFDTASLLPHSDSLEEKPVLLKAIELGTEMGRTLIDQNKKGLRLVLGDSSWQDLAIDLAGPGDILFSDDKTAHMMLEQDDLYVFYLDVSSLRNDQNIPLSLFVGDRQFYVDATKISSEREIRKYVEIGQAVFKKGPYAAELKSSNRNALTPKNLPFRFLFVDETQRNRAELLVLNVLKEPSLKVSYIFKQQGGVFKTKKTGSYLLQIKLAPRKGMGSDASALCDENLPGSVQFLEINGTTYALKDFSGWKNVCLDPERTVFKNIRLEEGANHFKTLRNNFFDIDWLIFEPRGGETPTTPAHEPTIVFKRINPAKYMIKVSNALRPFWLVFSSTFDTNWNLYPALSHEANAAGFENIAVEYPRLGVKEAKRSTAFIPEDVRLFSRKPLNAPHIRVNGYANGWFINPNNQELGNDFVLILYFMPQSLLYIGSAVTAFTLLTSLTYLLIVKILSVIKKQ